MFQTRMTHAVAKAEPEVPAVDVESALRSLDLLLSGQYAHVPEGGDDLSRKIKELSNKLHERDKGELRRVVDSSMTASAAVTAAAEMMRDVREVDNGAQSISSAAAEMVASVSEISSSAESASTEAGQANDSSRTAMTEAQKAVASMATISKAVEGAVLKVEDLAKASEQIGEIVSQIDAIAKQTNLLALNATIEAARAGEAGKGFAVVAGEVKTLANQTSKATDDIRQRINHLRSEMTGITSIMQDGAEAVEQGNQVIDATRKSMEDVSSRVGEVTSRMRDIAEILSQQAEASNEISSNITRIAEMSGHNVHAINHLLDIMDKTDSVVVDSVKALSEREIADFTIHVAKSDHMIWRRKLAQMAAGRISLNPDELANHHNCRLGKWVDSIQDAGIRNHPAYRAMATPHAKVHACGIEAARLFNQGNLDAALDKIHEADSASQEVLKLLDALIAR